MYFASYMVTSTFNWSLFWEIYSFLHLNLYLQNTVTILHLSEYCTPRRKSAKDPESKRKRFSENVPKINNTIISNTPILWIGDFGKWKNWWKSAELCNFIQSSLNSGSAHIQILLAGCQVFAMVRIFDSGTVWKVSK